MIYNLILAFLSEVVLISAARIGLGDHPDRIMIGIIMLLVSALGAINGMRDVMQRNFISGSLEVMNSMLGAFGIAFGIALAMMLMGNISAEGFDDFLYDRMYRLCKLVQDTGKEDPVFQCRSFPDMGNLFTGVCVVSG